MAFTDAVFKRLGPAYNCTVQYALDLSVYDFFHVGLEQLLMASIASMLVLVYLLVYGLMVTRTDVKTYEYGMLRALVCAVVRVWRGVAAREAWEGRGPQRRPQQR